MDFDYDEQRNTFTHPETGVTIDDEHTPVELMPDGL